MPRRVLLRLLFAVAIIISSANIFEKYISGLALLAYALAVPVALWALESCLLPRLQRLPARITLSLIASFLVSVTVLMVLLYPYTAPGGPVPESDRDEALNQASASLLRGEYPYHQRTYLDNPITPLPGALLLAAPFVVLGSSIWQTPVWLLLFTLALRRWLLDAPHLLALLLSIFLLAPKLLHEIISGGDFVANAAYIIVAFLLLIQTAAQPRILPALLAALFVGVALSSRMNWLPLLPLLAAAVAERAGWRRALTLSAAALLAFALVTLPLYRADPAAFSPLHTANKLRGLNGIVPYTAELTLTVVAVTSLLLAWRQRGMGDFFRNAAIVQFIPVLAGILIPIPLLGLDFTYGSRYGATYLLFAAVAYWLSVQRAAPPAQS